MGKILPKWCMMLCTYQTFCTKNTKFLYLSIVWHYYDICKHREEIECVLHLRSSSIKTSVDRPFHLPTPASPPPPWLCPLFLCPLRPTPQALVYWVVWCWGTYRTQPFLLPLTRLSPQLPLVMWLLPLWPWKGSLDRVNPSAWEGRVRGGLPPGH